MQFAEDATKRLVDRLRAGGSAVPLGHPLRLFSDLRSMEVYFRSIHNKWRRNNQQLSLAQKLRLA